MQSHAAVICPCSQLLHPAPEALDLKKTMGFYYDPGSTVRLHITLWDIHEYACTICDFIQLYTYTDLTTRITGVW